MWQAEDRVSKEISTFWEVTKKATTPTKTTSSLPPPQKRARTGVCFTLPCGQVLHTAQLRCHSPCSHRVALRALALVLAVLAGFALHAVVFHLPARKRVTLRTPVVLSSALPNASFPSLARQDTPYQCTDCT